jgi:hypothetical protein
MRCAGDQLIGRIAADDVAIRDALDCIVMGGMGG